MTPNIFDREVPPLKRRVPRNGSIEKICASIQQAQKSFSTSASGKPSRFAVSPKISARADGEVDDFRGHLGRDAENVCCPRTFGNNRPTVAPRERARGLIDVGAERSTEIRIHFRNVVKAAADAADGMVLDEGREGHIDGAPAGDVEKIFRHESTAS